MRRDVRVPHQVPNRTTDFTYRLAQVGVLLDLSETDQYLRRDAKSGELAPDDEARDGARWNLRARDGQPPAGLNVPFGGDFEDAKLRCLAPWPARKP